MPFRHAYGQPALSPNSYPPSETLLQVFFILKTELVDYFISLSQSLHLDNRSVWPKPPPGGSDAGQLPKSGLYYIGYLIRDLSIWKHKKKC